MYAGARAGGNMSKYTEAGLQRLCEEHRQEVYETKVKEMEAELREEYGLSRYNLFNIFRNMDDYMEEYERRRAEIDRNINGGDWF